MKIQTSTLLTSRKFFIPLFLLSLGYSYLNGSGFYGFSNDYYGYYDQPNANFYNWREISIILATLTIKKFHLGVYLTSFFIAISSGLLLRSYFKKKKITSFYFFLIIFFLTLHIHPTIMSVSGAMRQGWAMIFIFFSLSLFLDGKKILSLIMIATAIFMHKSGLFFFTVYMITIFSLYLEKKVKQKKFLLILIAVFISIIFFIFLEKLPNLTTQRIIGADLRYIWIPINLIYIFYYIYYYNFFSFSKINFISLFFFYISIFLPITVYYGFSYNYERLNMIIAIPLILTILSIIKKKSYYFAILTVMCLYLFFTIHLGMYSVGLT